MLVYVFIYPALGFLALILILSMIFLLSGIAIIVSGITGRLEVLDNSVYYLFGNFCMPSDMVYSFGVGIYGLIVLCVITLAFFKSKEWKEPA